MMSKNRDANVESQTWRPSCAAAGFRDFRKSEWPDVRMSMVFSFATVGGYSTKRP
jgi:hypothetical protein